MAETTPARHLLIPFAGRGSPACRVAQATLKLPQLEALLHRLSPQPPDAQAETLLSPPHERALAHALGLSGADGCLPWAALEARQLGLPQAGDTPGWAAITLCHWQVAIDELVLGDPAELRITAEESDSLLATARHLFEEDGITLHRSASPGRWLAQSTLFDTLPTASIDRAANQPISQWFAPTDANRPVRRLQNEMQMLLYTQRINDERIARGLPPINSFWISGTGPLPPSAALASQPVVVDALRTAALADDGAAWAAAWEAFDREQLPVWVADARSGADIAVTLCGDRASRRWVQQPRSIGGWIKGIFGRERLSHVLSSL